MEFAKKLLSLRGEKGITQAEAAQEVGITLRQYHRFEHGEQKPGYDNLRRIADFYEVSVDWLMGRTQRRDVWK